MTALEVLNNICNTCLIETDFKYCLVDKNKIPHTIINERARVDHNEDFVNIEQIVNAKNLEKYSSLGISIQASNISAIDVDHCFSEPFNFDSCDERGKAIYEMFKDCAYIEFSFSGTGLRILFQCSLIDNYEETYYIKNSKQEIEFYQPSFRARYVTITGKKIVENYNENFDVIRLVLEFLNNYMVRPKKQIKDKKINDLNKDKTLDQLKVIIKRAYFMDYNFQEFWFAKAPGSGKDESERDFIIIQYIFTNITHDKENVRLLFESSPYFKSKDKKHYNKWMYNNYRYYESIWKKLE